MRIARALCLLAVSSAAALGGEEMPPAKTVYPELIHLRSGTAREWSEFPEIAKDNHLEVRFSAAKNEREYCLRLRQQDVKQAWHVLLNGERLGALAVDENDMVLYFAVPAGALVDGESLLRI